MTFLYQEPIPNNLSESQGSLANVKLIRKIVFLRYVSN